MIIKIYQSKQPTFRVEEKCNLDDYNKVYEYIETFDDNIVSSNQKLEVIFEKFNINRPEDFKGHSLSVGDIVFLGEQAYVCDMIGWKKISAKE